MIFIILIFYIVYAARKGNKKECMQFWHSLQKKNGTLELNWVI